MLLYVTVEDIFSATDSVRGPESRKETARHIKAGFKGLTDLWACSGVVYSRADSAWIAF